MKYVLLIVLVLPHLSRAQSGVTGLGTYTIGITTPDSLNRAAFREEDQSYVRGTIALPCTHIRTFTSAVVTVAGISVTNFVLIFYDNRLAKLSGDYGDSLKAAFLKQYGPGVRRPVSRFHFCTKRNDRPLLMEGESWPGDDIITLVVYRRGYTAECKWEEGARLTIASRKMAALSSDCDIKPADPFMEEFSKAQTENQGKPR